MSPGLRAASKRRCHRAILRTGVRAWVFDGHKGFGHGPTTGQGWLGFGVGRSAAGGCGRAEPECLRAAPATPAAAGDIGPRGSGGAAVAAARIVRTRKAGAIRHRDQANSRTGAPRRRQSASEQNMKDRIQQYSDPHLQLLMQQMLYRLDYTSLGYETKKQKE